MRGGFAPNLSNLCPTAVVNENQQTQANRQAANSVIIVPELSELLISMMSASEIADSVNQSRHDACVAAILLAGAVDRSNNAIDVDANGREDTWQKLMLDIFPNAPQDLQGLTGQESNIPAPTTYKEMFSQWCQRNKELIDATAMHKKSIEDYYAKSRQSSASWLKLERFLTTLNINTLNNSALTSDYYNDEVQQQLENFKNAHTEEEYNKWKELHFKHRLDKYLANQAFYLKYELGQRVMNASERMTKWTDHSNGLPPPPLRRQPAMVHVPDPRNGNPNPFPYP